MNWESIQKWWSSFKRASRGQKALLLAALPSAVLAFLSEKLPWVALLFKAYPKTAEWISRGTGILSVGCFVYAIWRIIRAPVTAEEKRIKPPSLKGGGKYSFSDGELFLRLGRQDQLQKLWGWIVDPNIPLAVVEAESGAGKSSLLESGLQFLLKRGFDRLEPKQSAAIPCAYCEMVPRDPVADLLRVLNKAWNERKPGVAPENFTALEAVLPAVERVGERLVILLDQFEQLSAEDDRHKAIFRFLKQTAAQRTPCAITCILAYRKEYASDWNKFCAELDSESISWPKLLHLELFRRNDRDGQRAQDILATLGKEAGMNLEDVAAPLVEMLANKEGRVLPFDLSVSLTCLSGMRKEVLTPSDLPAGGLAALMVRYIRECAEHLPSGTSEAVFSILFFKLVENTSEGQRRSAEGRTLQELAEGSKLAAGELKASLELLAQRETGLLERIEPKAGEVRYRLLHERFIPALEKLAGVMLADTQKARAVFEHCWRVYDPALPRQRLLSGSDLSLVRRYWDQLPELSEHAAKNVYFHRSVKQHTLRRAAKVGAAVVVIAAVLAGWLGLMQRQLADARKLAADALSELSLDPQLSVLFAYEAARLRPVEGEDILRRCLFESQVRVVIATNLKAALMASFSPDSSSVAVAGRDGRAVLWAMKSKEIKNLQPEHGSDVNEAVFSPDGRWLVTASADGTAGVWDAHSGQPSGRFTNHTSNVKSAAFSTNGSIVVTAGEDQQVWIWDAATRQPKTNLVHPAGSVNRAVFSPSGQLVATACTNNQLRLWLWRQGRETDRGQHAGNVRDVAFSADGHWLVSASADGTAKVWAVQDGHSLALRSTLPHPAPVQHAVFSPGGEAVLTVAEDGLARLWDWRSGAIRSHLQQADKIGTAAFSPKGEFVVTAGADRTAQVSSANDGKPFNVLRGHGAGLTSSGFSPDARFVLTASADGAARLWELRLGEGRQVATNVRTAALSADGAKIILANDEQRWVHDWPSNSTTLSVTNAGSNTVHSTDGQWGVVVTSNGVQVVRVVPPSSVADTHSQNNPTLTLPAKVQAAAFSRDGRHLVIGCIDGKAWIWPWRSQRNARSLTGHAESVNGVAFDPSGRFIVTASADKTARVWTADTGFCFAVLRGHTDDLLAAGFATDGTNIITASRDGMVRVYSVPECCSGKKLLELAASPARATRQLTPLEKQAHGLQR